MVHASKASWQDGPSNDYHLLPVTEKQMRYARVIARNSALEIPVEAQRDRRALSAWISAHASSEGRGLIDTQAANRWHMPNGLRARKAGSCRPSVFMTRIRCPFGSIGIASF